MILLKSHGFKFGQPNANFVFDVSYLKNPWREKELRDAKKSELMKFMMMQSPFFELVNQFTLLIESIYKHYGEENLIFAFCCSAGEYRSPLTVELVAEKLLRRGIKVKIVHSENSKI